MKVGKSFTTFFVLSLLLGLGVWTSADAQAISNEDMVVTSPVAGTVLNIADNAVTVEITYKVFNADAKTYTAYVGLASVTGIAADTEASTLNVLPSGLILDDDSDAGEEALFEGVLAIASAANTIPTAHTLGSQDGRVLGSVAIPDFSAAQSAGGFPVGATLAGNVTGAAIEETSVRDEVRLTVTLSVGSDAGDVEDIVAFAIVVNTTADAGDADDGLEYSDLLFSPVAGLFDGDWDGPEIGSADITSFIDRLEAGGAVDIDNPETVAGGSVPLAPVAPGDRLSAEITATGQTQIDLFFEGTVTAQVRVNLDSGQGDDIILPVDPDVRNADDSAALVTYVFTDADFLDDGVGHDVIDEAQVIVAVELVDENGNPTAAETGLTVDAGNAAITVAGNTDAPTFSAGASTHVSEGVVTAFDNNAPVLAFAASPGVLPADGGAISDGGLNASLPDDGFGNAAIDVDGDGNDDIEAIANSGLIQFENEEAWKGFNVNFDDGADVDTDVFIENDGVSLTAAALNAAAADVIRFIDFEDPTSIEVTNDFTAAGERAVLAGASGEGTFSGANTAGSAIIGGTTSPTVPTGSYTLTFEAIDLADNSSNALVATEVWVDTDDPAFDTQAPPPTETTINENTANPAYELTEAVSVLELTVSLNAADVLLDDAAPHVFYGSGDFLSAVGVEQILPITGSLVDGARYTYSFRLRDLNGNWATISDGVERTYDVQFEEAIIAKFSVAVTIASNLAGDDADLTIIAQSDDDRGAGTYEGAATMTLNCNAIQDEVDADGAALYCPDCDAKAFPDCSGVTITGDGIVANGDGSWLLDADGWDSVGARDALIENDTATIEFTLTVMDDASEGGPYTGESNAVSYMPKAYTELNIWTADASAGSRFAVNVEATDEFGNIRWEDERLVNLGGNRPASLPGSLLLEGGTGTVWATATAGPLDILVTDPVALNAAQTTNGDNFRTGSLTVEVSVGGGPSAPGEVVADDYLGADGDGDQGGFIVITFTVPDGSSATAYQISREVTVFYDIDADTGELVHVGDGVDAFIPWGTVAASGQNPMRVVVATLDAVPSLWGVNGVAAPNVAPSAKQAFDGAIAVTSPYELMTQTMVESKKLAQLGPNVPVFAELTPDALSFIDGSFAPRFKDASGAVLESDMAITAEAVRAIDNIAPEPVSFIQAFDTPNDDGGSITISWVASESDGLLARTSNGAVGPDNSDTVLGVKGYNIYRSGFGSEESMVGKVAPGVSSFIDNTALNGIHYNYSVVPYDDDNLATSELSVTALSVRNVAFDSEGVLVQGLYGADSQVGFDDFFVFADHFGQLGGTVGFDAAFDLAPNNQIDFFDFFVFADNFGRVAVGASKVVPLAAGLNDNARIDLAAEALPRVGEEMVVNVSLADFVELKGYGFTVNFDPTTFEFVRVEGLDTRFGSEEIAQPQVIDDRDGQLSVVAYGQPLSAGELMIDLVLRPIAETENGLIEVSRGELADANHAFNQIASLGAIAVETRPEEFALQNNYPNPFNPSTTIKYQLPEAVDVRLEIYNVVGQVVRTLIGEQQNAGRYEYQWDATSNNGQSLSSGIYFYRLQAGEFQEVKKMLLMK
jgi:hypothetical protein